MNKSTLIKDNARSVGSEERMKTNGQTEASALGLPLVLTRSVGLITATAVGLVVFTRAIC